MMYGMDEDDLIEYRQTLEKVPSWILIQMQYAFMQTQFHFSFSENMTPQEKKPYVDHYHALCMACSDELNIRRSAV